MCVDSSKGQTMKAPSVRAFLVFFVFSIFGYNAFAQNNPNEKPSLISLFDTVCINQAGQAAFDAIVSTVPGIDKLSENEYRSLIFGTLGERNDFYDVTANHDRSILVANIIYANGNHNCAIYFHGDKKQSLREWQSLYLNKYSGKGKNKIEQNDGWPFYFARSSKNIIVLVQIGMRRDYNIYYTFYENAKQAGESYDSPIPDSAHSNIVLKESGGTLLVSTKINGQISLDFVLDSGASDVSIPADVVSTLIRTHTISDSDFTGVQTYVLADGTRVPSKTLLIHSLEVGGVTVKNVTASVSNIDGSLLLGQSFLKKFRKWSIDNSAKTLSLEYTLGQDVYQEKSPEQPTSGKASINSGAEPTFQISRSWSILKGSEIENSFLLFRRYAFDGTGLKNMIIFNCSKKENEPRSHLTFIFPPNTTRKFFSENAWLPKANVRIMTNNRGTFNLSGEYNAGELFIDKTADDVELFSKILAADGLSVSVEDNVIASYLFTDRVDKFIMEISAKKILPDASKIQMFEPNLLTAKCDKYQSN